MQARMPGALVSHKCQLGRSDLKETGDARNARGLASVLRRRASRVGLAPGARCVAVLARRRIGISRGIPCCLLGRAWPSDGSQRHVAFDSRRAEGEVELRWERPLPELIAALVALLQKYTRQEPPEPRELHGSFTGASSGRSCFNDGVRCWRGSSAVKRSQSTCKRLRVKVLA